MTLQARVEKDVTLTIDTAYQNTGSSRVYFTDDKTKPRSEWFFIVFSSTVKLPAGKIYTFYCNDNATLAEMEV